MLGRARAAAAGLAGGTRNLPCIPWSWLTCGKGLALADGDFLSPEILSIPTDYFEAAPPGRGSLGQVPLRHPPVEPQCHLYGSILLSFIGGLRSFDLIWAMTNGGPGFASDVLTSVIYKMYQAGVLRPVDCRQRRAVHSSS